MKKDYLIYGLVVVMMFLAFIIFGINNPSYIYWRWLAYAFVLIGFFVLLMRDKRKVYRSGQKVIKILYYDLGNKERLINFEDEETADFIPLQSYLNFFRKYEGRQLRPIDKKNLRWAQIEPITIDGRKLYQVILYYDEMEYIRIKPDGSEDLEIAIWHGVSYIMGDPYFNFKQTDAFICAK